MSVFNIHDATAGQYGRLQATAPSGLELIAVAANQIDSNSLNDGQGWGGGFYWAGGGVQTNDQTSLNPNVNMIFTAPSSYWGIQIICGVATCKQQGLLTLQSATLDVRETTPPTFAATGLSQTTGWVRGSWPFWAWSNSPSGVCDISATLNGLNVESSASPVHIPYAWHQCAAPAIDQTVDTSRYGNGDAPLVLSSGDTAGLSASTSTTIHIDNTQPMVSLSGPTDAPSTAGTQYVTATASAGPSGVEGISCSVDSAPAQWYTSPAVVPVSGVGEHAVQCSAANNAVDPAGNHGWSAPAYWSLKIGDPTVSGIAFGHIVDALRCRRAKQRVRVSARWVTVRRDHHLVKIKRRAHTKLVHVTKCHPRTKVRHLTVRVSIRRHGRRVWVRRRERERIVLLPHLQHSTKLRVGHGKTARISGWLGTSAGVALGGQRVWVLSAPANGLGRFRTTAVVSTAADGVWTTTLPAGPSRLVQAVYNGGPTTEASASGQVRITVPAEVKLLRLSPRKVAWGGTIRLVGQLVGGYLPAGGALVRLRIGEGTAQTTYGVREHIGGNGRFTTSYTFGAGLASIHRTFWFQVASLPTGNYPYTPAQSRRLSVQVGGHPRRR